MSYKITKQNVKKNGDTERGQIIISKSSNTPMSMKDLPKINDVVKKIFKNKNAKYYIRVHSNLPTAFTPKGFDMDDIDIDMIDNYINGKVKSKAKFDELYSVEIGYMI